MKPVVPLRVKGELQQRLTHPSPHQYKGRLGYACLNTILRNQKPPVFCSRTCRLDTIRQKGLEFAKDLGLQNVRDLYEIVEWNEVHNIKFMRISSDIFPFASHPDYGYSLEYAEDELRRVGDLAAKYNHRLTVHPGQYNQLGSPNASVVEKTIKDLSYHAEMLDLMGLPPDSIMIIHMGGVYGNKPLTLARFEETFKSLPEPIKRRLVLENDELGYSVTDLLPLCQKLSIPLVLDWHHHDINPGEATGTRLLDLIPSINELWTNRGMKPKQHYSESRPGAISIVERRAHSDRVVHLPPSTDDVDLMIEAKDKEQAVFKLYKLYNLHPVDDDVWIPDGKYKKETKMDRRVSRKKESRIQSEARTEIEIEVEEETYLGVRTRSQRRKKSKSAA